jgi:ArsR family transcriptional regulator, arsenate/arsenite/antimonite-responsive transcriptional repressor
METFQLVTCCHIEHVWNLEWNVREGAMRKTMLAVASHATQVNAGDTFSEPHAISALAALAQPTRLAIFRLLIKHEPIGITAGVIAETVGAPHNTLSSHLAILVRAGLLRSSRDGRTIIYRSDVEGMQSLISFLINDCCNGHPELCGLLGIDPSARCGCAPPAKKPRSKKQAVQARRPVRAR